MVIFENQNGGRRWESNPCSVISYNPEYFDTLPQFDRLVGGFVFVRLCLGSAGLVKFVVVLCTLAGTGLILTALDFRKWKNCCLLQYRVEIILS